MKNLLPTLLTALLCSSLFGQSFKSNFSFTGGNVGADEIRDITTDAQGNIYITGSFTDSVDFDPGAGTFYLTTPAGNQPDAFIQKLDANGNFLWAKSFRGTYNDYEEGKKIAVDDTGNVYVVGIYQRNIFFTFSGYQWPGNSNSNVYQPFLVKLDSIGNVKWGMGWKGNYTTFTFSGVTYYSSSWPYGFALDAAGDIFVTGALVAGLDFDPTLNADLSKYSSGGSDVFVVKVSNSGDVKNVVTVGGVDSEWPYTIDYHNGHLAIGGSFFNTVDFNPDTAVVNQVTSTGSNESYIWQLDTSLTFVSIASFGSISGPDFSVAIDHDNLGNLYNLGFSSANTIDLDPDPNTAFTLNSSNSKIYLQKLSSSGSLVWAKLLLSGANDARAYGISVSNQKNISITGRFSGTADADPNPTNTYNLTSSGGYDAFVIQLDSAGNFIAASSFGGTDDDIFWAAHFTQNNEVLAGGSFQNTIDIDPTAIVNQVTSNGQQDFMFLNLSLCGSQNDTLPIASCNNYMLSNGTVISQSGFYLDSLIGSDGCDSNITLDLTIRIINPSVSQTVDGLEAASSATNPTYQWMDCATQQIVQGATSQTFMPSVNGQYAVIVSDSICSDTSACFTINNVSINEHDLANSIAVFPNPTTGKLNITSNERIEKIEVYDLSGREMLTVDHPEGEVDLSKLSTGVYLVKIKTEKSVVVRRVVKE